MIASHCAYSHVLCLASYCDGGGGKIIRNTVQIHFYLTYFLVYHQILCYFCEIVNILMQCKEIMRSFCSTSFSLRCTAKHSSHGWLHEQRRFVTAERVKPGMLVRYENKHWRILKSSRSQKGKNVASMHVRLSCLSKGSVGRGKELTLNPTQDLPEANSERLKVYFSGYDDDDNACFVFPPDSIHHGKEINIPASELSETHQNFLAVRMPCDLLRINDEENEKEFYPELTIPVNYVYTTEKVFSRGMFKFATFEECDGQVTVTDAVQAGTKVSHNQT